MIMKFSRTLAVASIALLLAGSAYAQTASTSTTTPTTKAAPAEKKANAPRSATSIECSKQADAKGLHGKERKKFRSQCKKNASKPN